MSSADAISRAQRHGWHLIGRGPLMERRDVPIRRRAAKLIAVTPDGRLLIQQRYAATAGR